MLAAQYDRYGPPGVLFQGEAPVPELAAGRVLVKVAATSVNQIDGVIRSGTLRIASGFRFPKGVGLDFAGEVTAIGADVTGVTVGDRVWGFRPGLPRGRSEAAAEYVLSRPEHLSIAPATIDLADAAALPLVGSTALVGLRQHAGLRSGGRLLVRGASGGVGSAAVQLGKALGAHVTALTSDDTLDLVRELGADAALDYRTHGPSSLGKFDAILDLTGTHLAAYRALLTPGGRMVTTSSKSIPYILFSLVYGPHRVRAFSVAPNRERLDELADYVTSGALKPVIHRRFPLNQIAAAHQALLDGGVQGKIVVTIP